MIREYQFPRNFARINEMRILEFLSNTVSFELSFLETIGYFIIFLSKKVLIFTESVLKPETKVVEKIFLRENAKFTPAKSL